MFFIVTFVILFFEHSFFLRMDQNISTNIPLMETLGIKGFDFFLISGYYSYPTHLWQMVHFSPRIRSLIIQDPCIRSYKIPFPAQIQEVSALLNFISTNQIEITKENCYFMWRCACEFESLPLLYAVKNFLLPLLNSQNVYQYFVGNSPAWTIPHILEFFATYPVYIESLIQNKTSNEILEQIFLLCSQHHTFPAQNIAACIFQIIQRDGLQYSSLFSTVDYAQLNAKDVSFITKNILNQDVSGSLWFSLKYYIRSNNWKVQNQPPQVFQQVPQQNIYQQQQQQMNFVEPQQNQYQQQQNPQTITQPIQPQTQSSTIQYQQNLPQAIQTPNITSQPQISQNQQAQVQQVVSSAPVIPKPSSTPAVIPSVPKPGQAPAKDEDEDTDEYEEDDDDDDDENDDDEDDDEEEEEEEVGDFEVDPGDFPYDADEPLHGIFYHMAQCIGSPVLYGLCSMTGGGERIRSLKYLIDMNDRQRWWCNRIGRETHWKDAWFTIKFLKHTVKLTNYTLYCMIGSPFCAQPKSWKLWGANLSRGQDWTLLDEQKNVKGMNCKNAMMTFPIPKKRQGVYTDYKIVCTENFTKHEDGKFFLTKIEFFGSLLYQ